MVKSAMNTEMSMILDEVVMVKQSRMKCRKPSRSMGEVGNHVHGHCCTSTQRSTITTFDLVGNVSYFINRRVHLCICEDAMSLVIGAVAFGKPLSLV